MTIDGTTRAVGYAICTESVNADHNGVSVLDIDGPSGESNSRLIFTDGSRSSPMMARRWRSASSCVSLGSTRMSTYRSARSGTVLAFSPLFTMLGLNDIWQHECRLLAVPRGRLASAAST